MKKQYIAPELDIYKFKPANVIATSGSISIGGEGDFDAPFRGGDILGDDNILGDTSFLGD